MINRSRNGEWGAWVHQQPHCSSQVQWHKIHVQLTAACSRPSTEGWSTHVGRSFPGRQLLRQAQGFTALLLACCPLSICHLWDHQVDSALFFQPWYALIARSWVLPSAQLSASWVVPSWDGIRNRRGKRKGSFLLLCLKLDKCCLRWLEAKNRQMKNCFQFQSILYTLLSCFRAWLVSFEHQHLTGLFYCWGLTWKATLIMTVSWYYCVSHKRGKFLLFLAKQCLLFLTSSSLVPTKLPQYWPQVLAVLGSICIVLLSCGNFAWNVKHVCFVSLTDAFRNVNT